MNSTSHVSWSKNVPRFGVEADLNPNESTRELTFDIAAKMDPVLANAIIRGEDGNALCTVAPH